MASPEYPFYFAWADETERTFGPQHEVVDEDILSFEIKHDEGQVPTLDIVVRNPRIGLLNPGRKVWAWFSWQNPSSSPGAVEPLFFGVLVGVPTNIFAEKVSLSFIARSPTYIEDKQAVAETMKVAPYYDGIFLDDTHRDEPDSILEGWSALWHVDRTTLETTASDILIGEDGTAVFTMDDAFYDSLGLTLGQAPLTNVRVEATVKWTQRTTGFVVAPTLNVASYTGDTFMSDWPKGGAGLGGGWKVEYSYVADTYHVAETPTASQSSSSTHYGDTSDYDCATVSISQSSSWPALLSPNALNGELTSYFQIGVCDPYSDPPTNTPATYTVTGQIVPEWFLQCDMTLRYDARRTYTEFLSFDLITDTQGIITSPTVQQNTELLTISGTDVGEPLEEVDAWSDFANLPVGLGQIIFPNNPTTPGGLAHQVCVHAGTAGPTEPLFSDLPGTITNDGGVQWASMGLSPLTKAPDWSSSTFVPVGEIICYQEVAFDIHTGDFEAVPNSTTYYLCTGEGETNSTSVQFSYVPPVQTSDQGTPAPITIDHIYAPEFTTAVGAQIVDGSVTWTCLGASPAIMQIPIGGTPDNVTARCYFPTDRGALSVQYLIAKARARLRLRSRAVKVSWDCPFHLAVPLSCRKNAMITDPRLPGGTATGKIISYSLKGDGKGKFRGHVEIGCAVGRGGTTSADVGVGEYAASGYMQVGYQIMDGAVYTFPNEDIGYTPPVFAPFDDGIVFPIVNIDEVCPGATRNKWGEFNMTAAEQAPIIEKSFPIASLLAELTAQVPAAPVAQTGAGGVTTVSTGFNVQQAWYVEQQKLYYTSQDTPYVMEANPVAWNAFLMPVVNGPFEGSYSLNLTPLAVPQGINLEAPSNL